MCSDAGAVVWACMTVSVSGPAGVLSALLCSDAGAVVWACKCACMGC